MHTDGAPGPVVASKLSAPALGRPAVPRPGLVERMADRHRVAFLVAPAGYGKSVLAQQWLARQPEASAVWLSVDLVDGQPSVFWKHVVVALRAASTTIDDEPLRLLDERGAGDPTFLAALCGQVLAAPTPISVVLDDLDRVTDASVLRGLEFLAERAAGSLHLVVTGRREPGLPLARWRAVQRAELIDQSDLRFDEAEAVAFATTVDAGTLGPAEVRALNRQVEGWPMGLQLALVAARGSGAPQEVARPIDRSAESARSEGRDGPLLGESLIADYVVAEVLDVLPAEEREVALDLSVLTWFDLALCAEVAGPDATRVVRRMRERHLFLSTLDQPDTLRFHDLFRQFLEKELRWQDPVRHQVLHRRAAEALMARGERLRAHRHFLAAEDVSGAVAAVAPAIELVDEGHAEELARRLEELPDDLVVPTATQATDLALAWYVAGGLVPSLRWLERAEAAAEPDDLDVALRIAILRMMHAMGRCQDDAVTLRHLERCDRLRHQVVEPWPFTRRFDAVAARFAVVAVRPDAAERVAVVVDGDGPPPVPRVFVPAVEAVRALLAGDLLGASGRASSALAAAEELGLVEHPALMEALVAGSWCALGRGDLEEALALAGQGRDSTVWNLPWFQVRTGVIEAEVLRLRDGGPAALAALDALVADHPDVSSSTVVGHALMLARASALVACGRIDRALAVLDGLPDGPAVRVLRARALVRARRYDEVAAMAGAEPGWPAPQAVEAGVLRAIALSGGAADDALHAALRLGGETGWVSPFLGHGSDLSRLLDRLPVAELHPGLARVLRPPAPVTAVPVGGLVPLTARERSLLELLPTHYTNAQMGEQVYLSVNTVKTNLKALYRKLHVSSRAQAVAVARSAGLLPEAGGRSSIGPMG